MLHYHDEKTEAMAQRIRAVFCNQGLQDAATLMAAVSEHAIQYIEQAPAVVLSATFGEQPRSRRERAKIAQWFGSAVQRKPKLSRVMAHYHLPTALRLIAGTSLAFRYYDAVACLSKMNNSTLAQIIPPREERQKTWLASLSKWCVGMDKRGKAKSYLFPWAATALSGLNTADSEMALDLIDFICSSRRPFNERWTLQQAKRAEGDWHAELVKRDGAAEFFQRFNVGFADAIDYTPFPRTAAIGGYEFAALDSGEKIFAEGIAMHHCVSTYCGQVLHGLSRLFSIQKDGVRIATVEYAIQSNRYRAAQIKGPCNRAVIAAVRKAATDFADLQPKPL